MNDMVIADSPSIHDSQLLHSIQQQQQQQPDNDDAYSYHNLFLTQFQQLKRYQYHQSINSQSNNSLDSNYYNNSSIEYMLHSILHSLIIVIISTLLIGTVFFLMYIYLTHDHTYNNYNNNNPSMLMQPVTIVVNFIASMANHDTAGSRNGLQAHSNSIFPSYPHSNSLSKTIAIPSTPASSSTLCTIKINMISKPG